jgi:excinuclease ABC subunit B
MYADKITAMQKTIDETDYRRTKQINFNTVNNQVPQALNKKK